MIGQWFWKWRERRASLKEWKNLAEVQEAILIDSNPNPIELVQSALARDDLALAAERWDRARALVPNYVVHSKESLWILMALERYDELNSLMRERQRRIRGDQFYMYGLAVLAERRGDFTGAVELWKAASKSDPKNVGLNLFMAANLQMLDRLVEADAIYEKASQLFPENKDVWLHGAQLSDRKADWHKSQERWAVLADRFDYKPAFASRGRALIELGALDEAEKYLKEGAFRYPDSRDIAVARSELAERRGDLTAACELWGMVRRADPLFKDGYQAGCRALVATGRNVEADALMRDAIAFLPNEVWPLRDFARLAHDRQDWDEAVKRWEMLRKNFPAEESGYSMGIEALNFAGRGQEAERLGHNNPSSATIPTPESIGPSTGAANDLLEGDQIMTKSSNSDHEPPDSEK